MFFSGMPWVLWPVSTLCCGRSPTERIFDRRAGAAARMRKSADGSASGDFAVHLCRVSTCGPCRGLNLFSAVHGQPLRATWRPEPACAELRLAEPQAVDEGPVGVLELLGPARLPR